MKASIDQQANLQRILVGWIFAILSIQGLCIPIPIFAQSSMSPVIFKDVTEAVGINFVHSFGKRSSLLPEDVGSGAAFADYDNDGHIDLYVVNNPGPLDTEITEGSPGNVLYRNNGDGTFTDVTDGRRGLVIVATVWAASSAIMTTTEIWTSMSRTMSKMYCIATTAMVRLPMSP